MTACMTTARLRMGKTAISAVKQFPMRVQCAPKAGNRAAAVRAIVRK